MIPLSSVSLIVGIALCAAALVIVALVVIGPSRRRADPGEEPLQDAAGRSLRARTLEVTERAMRSRRIAPFTAEELELAGVRSAPAAFFLTVLIIAGAALVLGLAIALTLDSPAGFLVPVAFVLGAVLGSRLLLSVRTARRRAAFAAQLDEALSLIASGLRAGNSLVRAIDAVSRDSESPMAEEFARIVNENRLGRDLGQAMEQSAARMKSDDLAWTSRAIEVHREVGGNLGEVLDHVGETIRERNQVKRQVATLSAEGRLSGRVLIALPIGVALLLSVLSPGYITVFFSTPIGLVLLGVSLVLFIVGVVWMRAITRIDF